MNRKPSEHFSLEIEPAFTEACADPLSERRANALARAIDHHLNWTYEYYCVEDPARLLGARDVKTFRRKLIDLCPPLQMMSDLSDAAHHRFLTRPSEPPRIIQSSTAAYSDHGTALWVNGYDSPFLEEAARAVRFWYQWKD
jgi:hypothetical protein